LAAQGPLFERRLKVLYKFDSGPRKQCRVTA